MKTKTTRINIIIETLEANPKKKFTAWQLTEKFIECYSEALEEKRKNFATEDQFIQQLAAEIGGERIAAAKKRCPQVSTRDNPRPCLYFWQEESTIQSGYEVIEETIGDTNNVLKEQDLYPLLMEYLK